MIGLHPCEVNEQSINLGRETMASENLKEKQVRLELKKPCLNQYVGISETQV